MDSGDNVDIDNADIARSGDDVDDRTVEQAERQPAEDDDLRESLGPVPTS
jgi:nitric oxide reductase activation protein